MPIRAGPLRFTLIGSPADAPLVHNEAAAGPGSPALRLTGDGDSDNGTSAAAGDSVFPDWRRGGGVGFTIPSPIVWHPSIDQMPAESDGHVAILLRVGRKGVVEVMNLARVGMQEPRGRCAASLWAPPAPTPKDKDGRWLVARCAAPSRADEHDSLVEAVSPRSARVAPRVVASQSEISLRPHRL